MCRFNMFFNTQLYLFINIHQHQLDNEWLESDLILTFGMLVDREVFYAQLVDRGY